MFDKCNINMYNQKYVYYSVYPNIGSVCPAKLCRGSIDQSLFTDTQLGSGDSGLCLLTDLKQNMKKVRGRHCDNDRLLINSIFMLNEGYTVRHSLDIRTFHGHLHSETPQ